MQLPERARQAATRLVEGNREFVREFEASVPPDDRSAMLSTANPFAVVLSCSDSRVPPEIVLDQDIGQVFTVRVAGNVAGSAEIASIDYAVVQWGCPLVLVLGHTRCGAVAAALDPSPPGAERGPDVAGSPHLASLLVEIRSNVALGRGGSGMPGATGMPGAAEADPWREAVEANVRRSAESLRQRSGLIRTRLAEGSLAVVGAIYDVETGIVRLLDVTAGVLPGAEPTPEADSPSDAVAEVRR